jgi:hypothetical protein
MMHQRCSRRQPLGHSYPSPKQAKQKQKKIIIKRKQKQKTRAHTKKL